MQMYNDFLEWQNFFYFFSEKITIFVFCSVDERDLTLFRQYRTVWGCFGFDSIDSG